MAAVNMGPTNPTLATRIPGYRQVIIPNNVVGTYAADDQDNHDFRVDARGKSKLTIFGDNPSDETVTMTVYGAQTKTSEIGDSDVIAIDGFVLTLTTVTADYEVSNDPFPYYIIRSTSGSTPDGSTVSIWANLVN